MDKLPKVGTAVFVWRDGKFLMSRRQGSHGSGTWCVPGGHLEFGESLEDCVRRETREETGMKITNVRFLAVTNDIFETENKHYITVWMEADWQANEPAITEPDKFSDQGWFDFQSLPEPLFEPGYSNLRRIKPELFA